MTHAILGLFNLGGGEVILILAMLFLLVMVPIVLAGIIFLVIRMTQKTGNCASSAPPPIQGSRP